MKKLRTHSLAAAALTVMLGTGVGLSVAFAQPTENKPAPPAGYEPVRGGEARAESAGANSLVAIAYGAIFVLVFGYVIHVARSQTAVSRSIEELSAKLERNAKC